jgi:hypothetical protein
MKPCARRRLFCSTTKSGLDTCTVGMYACLAELWDVWSLPRSPCKARLQPSCRYRVRRVFLPALLAHLLLKTGTRVRSPTLLLRTFSRQVVVVTDDASWRSQIEEADNFPAGMTNRFGIFLGVALLDRYQTPCIHYHLHRLMRKAMRKSIQSTAIFPIVCDFFVN